MEHLSFGFVRFETKTTPNLVYNIKQVVTRIYKMNYKLRLKNAFTQMDWIVKVFRLRIQGMEEAKNSIAGILQADGISRGNIQDSLNGWHKNLKVISPQQNDIEETLASYGWVRAIEEVLTYQLLDYKRAMFHLDQLVKLERAYLQGMVQARANAMRKFPNRDAKSEQVSEYIEWIKDQIEEVDKEYPTEWVTKDCKTFDGELYLYYEVLGTLTQ